MADQLAFVTGGQSPAPAQQTGLSPDAMRRRQGLIDAMTGGGPGADYSPVASPWEGVSRVANATMSGLESNWLAQRRAGTANPIGPMGGIFGRWGSPRTMFGGASA